MPSYAHKKLVEEIRRLDELPSDPAKYSKWIEAGAHLDFLHTNAVADETVVYGSGPHLFIHSMIVPNDRLSPPDYDDLLGWSCNPFTSIASYVYGGGREEMWIERAVRCTGSETLDAGSNLVFGRTFDGWPGDDRTYFEINQEYTHLTGIHWRPEYRSYCRFDENGDLFHAVSVTARSDGLGDVALVSFAWKPLEEYLAISNSSLVRMFDFTLLRYEAFAAWPDDPEQVIRYSADFIYRQKILQGQCAYTRGVQLIRPRRSILEASSDIKARWSGGRTKQYAEFIALDWRNKRIAKISTDPAATTNYFEAKGNTLPFELSPAFFRAEVLSKYKTDRDKYTIGERDIHCRAAWTLRAYDVNEAGQIHAYICYLRDLPYAEQLHWLSFNEEPKAPISERAYINDFKGEFVTFTPPLQEVLSIVGRWRDKRVAWWVLRDKALLERVSVPLTASRDEWGEAFMDLSKLVVEGFEVKVLRKKLDEASIAYDEKEQSIALAEKVIQQSRKSANAEPLEGLRTVQRIRSKVKGHAGSNDAKQLAEDALRQHESYAGHFQYVCGLVAAELEELERAM